MAMVGYIICSIAGGLLFGLMDGLINANPLAVRLFSVFKPIARTTINAPAGLVIDLAYGFILAGLFLLLYPSLPGQAGWIKGLAYGLIVWFFRVVMGVISQWMMYIVPVPTLFYTLAAGLLEMMVLGLLFGLVVRPF
jgi:hypothetical protein